MTLTTRTVTNAGAPLHATDGAVLANATITFTLVDHIGGRSDAWDAVTSERVGGDPIAVTTDAMGEFSVALWPNSRGSAATRYLCTVNSAGFRPMYGVVEDAAQPLPWVSFMANGTPLTPQEISQLTQYLGEIEAARDAAEGAAQAVIASLGSKVDKIPGKGLSTEDYSTAEKSKLANVAAGATANDTDAQLRDRATHTGAQAISTVTGLQDALDAVNAAKVDKTARGAANGVASLDASGKVPASELPAIAITDVFTVASQAAMLALTAERGDVAVRSDLNKSFALAAEPASTLANWVELRTPTDAVLSVAGKTGAVTLAKADVGLSNVDNTSDANKPVSTAQAAAIATATAIHPFLLIGA